MRTKSILQLGAIVMLALLVSGCGRRGSLEPPPDTPQGQALARQRAKQNAQRGLIPTAGANSPNVTADPDTEKAAEINQESDARDEDARSDQEKASTADSPDEAPMAFPTGKDMVRAPTVGAAPAKADGLSPSRGRKPPGLERPDRPFILDPLLK